MAGRPGGGAGAGPGGTSGRGGRRPGGSSPSTRRTTRVEPADSGSAPRRTSSFTSRALILVLVLAVLGVSYASSIRAWLNLRSEQNSLTAQIAAQRAAIAALKQQQARWSDPAYIETMARLRFGWVMPGEHSYRVIGKDGTVLKVGNDTLTDTFSDSGTAQPPWWAGAAGSLVRADAPPAPEKPAHPTRHPAKRIGLTPGGSTTH
jgi:cell division protein FtsL